MTGCWHLEFLPGHGSILRAWQPSSLKRRRLLSGSRNPSSSQPCLHIPPAGSSHYKSESGDIAPQVEWGLNGHRHWSHKYTVRTFQPTQSMRPGMHVPCIFKQVAVFCHRHPLHNKGSQLAAIGSFRASVSSFSGPAVSMLRLGTGHPPT